MWTIQQLVQLIKDDLELYDLPATVTDDQILSRIKRSSLMEFSIVYPRIERFRLTYNDMVEPGQVIGPRSRGIEYYIPKWFLIQFTPVCLIRVDPFRHGDYYGDTFAYSVGYDATDLITDIAEVKAMAGVAGNMAHAPTPSWDSSRNVITLYNAYYDGCYEVEMGVEHDDNLRTIPPTAMLTFRQLATYDVGEYIYSKIFRKDGVETGVGTVNLNIQNLQECKQKHADLLKELSDEAQLDTANIEFF